MRVWDLPPSILCRAHLLGEHRELHAVWVVITQKRKGYSQHPETLRWRGKLKALYLRHQRLVAEMKRRGWNHFSDLPARLARGAAVQKTYVDSPARQKKILKQKACACRV